MLILNKLSLSDRHDSFGSGGDFSLPHLITLHPKDSGPLAKSPEPPRPRDDDSVSWVVERIMGDIAGLIPATEISPGFYCVESKILIQDK